MNVKMLKFAIVFTMHRQVEELRITSSYLKHFCDTKCDIFIHSNGNTSALDIVKKYFKMSTTFFVILITQWV